MGKREVEKFEFELELAALLGKLPLEGLDFVGWLEILRIFTSDH
jgi:hypothetical protein